MEKKNYFTIAAKPSKYNPSLKLCSVCGFTSQYTCQICGSLYCSLKCRKTNSYLTNFILSINNLLFSRKQRMPPIVVIIRDTSGSLILRKASLSMSSSNSWDMNIRINEN